MIHLFIMDDTHGNDLNILNLAGMIHYYASSWTIHLIILDDLLFNSRPYCLLGMIAHVLSS